MAFVSELQFCMTRELVGDAFLLLPFALFPNCFRFLFCSVLPLLYLYALYFCMVGVHDASACWRCFSAFTFCPFTKLFSFSILFCFAFTLYVLHFCMAFVSELQFCMTRALVDDVFLLLPFALLPFCQIVFVFYFVVFCVYFVWIVFLYGGRA